MLIVSICYSLTGFLMPFYLQDVLRLSATQVGLLFMAPSVFSPAFEFHTGIKAAALTAENSAGFVAALNTTFLAAIVLCVAGVFTSALRGAPKPA